MQRRQRQRNSTSNTRQRVGLQLSYEDLDPDAPEAERPRRRSGYRAQPTMTALKTLGALRKGHRGYIEMDYELVEQLAANGLTQAEIAEGLAVSYGTVADRLHGQRKQTTRPDGTKATWSSQPDAEFVAAFTRGRAQMRHLISNGIFTKAIKGDSASLFFLARTRMGWRESEVEKAPQNFADIAAILREELDKTMV